MDEDRHYFENLDNTAFVGCLLRSDADDEDQVELVNYRQKSTEYQTQILQICFIDAVAKKR